LVELAKDFVVSKKQNKEENVKGRKEDKKPTYTILSSQKVI
jgi:hypothetical protein